jgi:hypothetical protein
MFALEFDVVLLTARLDDHEVIAQFAPGVLEEITERHTTVNAILDDFASGSVDKRDFAPVLGANDFFVAACLGALCRDGHFH